MEDLHFKCPIEFSSNRETIPILRRKLECSGEFVLPSNTYPELKEIFQKVRIQKFVSLPTSSFLDMLLKVNQSSTALTISITLCSNIESSFSGEHLTFCEPKSIGNSKSFDDFFHNEETRLGSVDETNKTIHYQDNHPSTFHVDENSKSTVLSSTTSSTSISQAGAKAENSTLHSLHSVSLVANFLSLSGFAGLCDVIIHHGISGKDEAISALFVPMGPIKALLLIDVTSLSKKHSLFKKVNSRQRDNAQSSVDEKENQFAKLLKEFCCALSEDELKRNIEIYKSNGSKAKFRSIHRNQMNSSVSVDSCNSSTADGRSQVLSEIAIKNTLKSPIPLRENESKLSSIHRENSIKIISKTSIKPQSRGVRMQQKVKSGGDSFSRTKMSNQLLLSKKETRFPFSELPPPELSLMEESNSVLGMQCNSHSLLTAPATEIDAYLPTACPPPSASLTLSKPSDFTPETIPLREKLFTTEESTTTDKSGYTSCSPVELSTSSLILGLDVPLIEVETTISPAEESVTFRKTPKSKATSLNSESVVLRRSPRMLLKETDHLGNTVDFISNSVPVPAAAEISESKNTTPEAASASADRYCLRGVSTSSSGARTPSFETFSFAQTPSSIAINYYTSASGFTPNENIKSSEAESVYLEMIVSPDNAVPALQEDSCCSLIGVEFAGNLSVCAHDSNNNSSSSSPLHNVNSNDGISLFQSVVGGGSTRSAAQSKLRPNSNEEKRQKIEEPIPDSACLHTLPQMEVVNTAEIVADGQPGQADDRQEDAKINEKLSQAHEGFSNLEEIPQSIKNLLHRCLLCRQISPMDCAKELLHIIEQCTEDDMPSSSTTTSGGKRKMKTVDNNSKQKNSKISTSCYRSVCQVRLWNALVTILREVVWKKIGSDAEKIELFCGCCIILIVLEIENSDRRILSMALNAPTADGGKGKMRGDQQNIQTLKKSMDLYINRLSTALSSNFLFENDQQRLSLGWLIIESGTEISKDGEKGRPPFRSVSMRSITDLLYDNYSNSSMWSHVTGILEEFIEEDGPTVSPETLEKENLTTMVTDIDTQSISVTHAAAPVQDNFYFTNSVPVVDSSPPEPLPTATAGGLSGAVGAPKSSLSSKGKIVVDRKSSLIGHRISMGQKKRVTIDPSYAVNLERRNTERIQSQLKRALTFSGLSPSPSNASDPNAIDMIPSTQFSIMDDSGGVTFKRSGQRQRAQIIQETPCEHQGRSQEKHSLKRHRSESDAISRRSRFEINPAWAAPPSPSPSMMFLSGELACQPYDYSASPVVTAKEGRMDFDLLASSTSSAQDRAETFLGIGDGSFLRSSTAASETMVTSAEGMRRPARRKTALDTSGVLLFQEES